MPLSGGAAAKFGDRYEGRWAAHCLLDVLSGKADCIRFEPPGPEGKGVEFWVQRSARREYWQVKRQQAGKAGWTPRDLAPVLQSYWYHLQNAESDCVFASTQSVADIPELHERAQRTKDYTEFAKSFLDSEKLRETFAFLLKIWDASGERVYEALRRIRVSTVDEENLARLLHSCAELLLSGEPMTAVDVLTALALDSVHLELSGVEILAHLESRGHIRQNWNDAPGLARIEELNNAFMNPLRLAAIGGHPIVRAEAEKVLELLGSDGSRCILVSGEAGVGKSAVLLEVIESVRNRGWPVLAVRVDRLEPVLTPSEIGAQLGLHGSPATVLGGVAEDADGLLVIDQVDAVSLASGRHPEFLDCVLEMVYQARNHPNLQVLISVRTYDAENDPRLKAFASASELVELVKVHALSVEQTRAVLAAMGVRTEGLGDERIELFRLPLHLSLFAEGGASSEVGIAALSSPAQLLSRFWEHKSRMVSTRLERSARWTEVIDRLCDSMSSRQRLFVPEALLDDLADDLRAMASERVVIVDDGRVSFFHQAFFDYAFARRFLARSGNALDFLLSGEQHLFRRTQVRAVLQLQRDQDFDAYLANLAGVVTSEGVRYHVRRAVFDMLIGVPTPTAREWAVVKSELERGHDPDSVWRLLGSSAWFRTADAAGSVAPWFASEVESIVDRAVQLATIVLRSGDEGLSDRIAAILSQHVGTSESWASRLRYVATWCEVSASRGYFELFLRLLSGGALDSARGPIAVNSDFWSIPYSLAKRHPDWAAELIGCYLRRRSQVADELGIANPFAGDGPVIPDSQATGTIFKETVEGDPLALATQIVPWIIETASKNRITRDDKLDTDHVWSHQFYGWGHSFDQQLFTAAELALQRISTDNPVAAVAFIRELRNANLASCHHLAMRAYAENPRFADEAVDYLLSLPDLSIGYIDAGYAVTRDLIRAASARCSDPKIDDLSAKLLAYYPQWEKSENGRKSFGHAQFVLLSAIREHRRSGGVTRRLAELERRFGESVAHEEPRGIEVKSVPALISSDASTRMTDEQWVAAIERYDRDETHHRSIDDIFGGAHELAQVLGERTSEDPQRFARLIERLPDETNNAYFEAVLNALADSDFPTDLVVAACERCHRLKEHPCGTAICRTIRKRAESKLPSSALDMIAWYATQDPDPTSDRGNVWTEDDRDDSARDLLTKAINCVRGEAADAIGALLFADSGRLAHLLPAIIALVNDPRTIVRTTAAHAALAIMRCDRDLAIALLLQLCDSPDDRLLKTPYVERLLYFALGTHFDEVQAIIERMLASDDAETTEVGARIACLASLTRDEAVPLSRECLRPEARASIRQGAATIFASNLRTAHLREECERALLILFQDQESTVRGEAAECFGGFAGNELTNFGELIESFLNSPAFLEHHFDLLRALDETTATMPEIMCAACERFVETVGGEAGDIRTAASAHAEMVCRLALRVYAAAYETDIRRRALDVIDKMMKFNYYGLEQAIGAYSV